MNAVGVDVNTASVPLLTRVSGLTETVAENIVQFRNKHGRFASRADLRAIPRLGDKTFELAAGFLRIPDGDNPLDASAVHPESYELVEKILQDSRTDIKNVIGNESLLKTVKPEKYVSDRFGIPTIVDILKELEKPGRDPRPEFVSAHFREGVEDIKDLRPDMILEGVVTNVTAFGAFVDIGRPSGWPCPYLGLVRQVCERPSSSREYRSGRQGQCRGSRSPASPYRPDDEPGGESGTSASNWCRPEFRHGSQKKGKAG